MSIGFTSGFGTGFGNAYALKKGVGVVVSYGPLTLNGIAITLSAATVTLSKEA